MPERTLRNRILCRLSSADRALLEPHLERVELPLRTPLEVRNKRIEHAYFLEDGIASVVANGTNDTSIEVGLIGSEVMTGLAVVMGADRAAHATYMQVAGMGYRPKLCATRLSKALSCSASSCVLPTPSLSKPPTPRWPTVATKWRSVSPAGC